MTTTNDPQPKPDRPAAPKGPTRIDDADLDKVVGGVVPSGGNADPRDYEEPL